MMTFKNPTDSTIDNTRSHWYFT